MSRRFSGFIRGFTLSTLLGIPAFNSLTKPEYAIEIAQNGKSLPEKNMTIIAKNKSLVQSPTVYTAFFNENAKKLEPRDRFTEGESVTIVATNFLPASRLKMRVLGEDKKIYYTGEVQVTEKGVACLTLKFPEQREVLRTYHAEIENLGGSSPKKDLIFFIKDDPH